MSQTQQLPLQVSAPLAVHDDALADVAAAARRAESEGIDGVSFGEMRSDPMLHMTLAAGATERLDLLTNVVVAFARSPMVLAMQARNVQEFSAGRFTLGLGSQIKAHIERRFAMPWSAPAARMTEYVSALHAIWGAWATGDRLDFRGDFYQHTLMSPMFTPTSQYPDPKVYLAAVGDRMTQAAGTVADGLLVHPFSTERYLREITLPAVTRARGERGAEGFDVVHTPFVITGRTEDEYADSWRKVRSQIAFYGSTPAYRPVLELHGWGSLANELNRLSTTRDTDRWNTMATLIDDDVIEAFAVAGPVEDIGNALTARLAGLVNRVEINHVGMSDPDLVLAVAHSIKSAAAPR